MKESAGYPDTSGAFYSNNVFPTVTLTASVPEPSTLARSGPASGSNVGLCHRRLDRRACSCLLPAQEDLDPGQWILMSQKSDYRVLVPPSVKVSVEVSAPGYKTWFYDGGPSDTLNRPPIRLDSVTVTP